MRAPACLIPRSIAKSHDRAANAASWTGYSVCRPSGREETARLKTRAAGCVRISGLRMVDRPVPADRTICWFRASHCDAELSGSSHGEGRIRLAPESSRSVPLSDCVGVIEEVSPGITKFLPGDRVIAGFFEKWLGGDPTAEKLSRALGAPLRSPRGIPGLRREQPRGCTDASVRRGGGVLALRGAYRLVRGS